MVPACTCAQRLRGYEMLSHVKYFISLCGHLSCQNVGPSVKKHVFRAQKRTLIRMVYFDAVKYEMTRALRGRL